MNSKKLDPKSIYNKYDIDHDGTVSDEEMARNKELLELELQEEKSETQKQMAWVAMISILVGFAAFFATIANLKSEVMWVVPFVNIAGVAAILIVVFRALGN